MKTIIMTKGLPGSGKTTWARERMADTPHAFKRVNKDPLRDMLDDGRWSHDNEKFVLEVRDKIIAAALSRGENGKSVIVDDTNLVPKHEERLRQLARENHAAFEI